VAIDAYKDNTMALKSDGMVVVYGDNTYGQCNIPVGLNLFEGESEEPEEPGGEVPPITWPLTVEQAKAYAKLIKGYGFALKADGNVVSWDATSGNLKSIPKAAQGDVTSITTLMGTSTYNPYTYLVKKSNGVVVPWDDDDIPNSNNFYLMPLFYGAGDLVDLGIDYSFGYKYFALMSNGDIVTWRLDSPSSTSHSISRATNIISKKGNPTVSMSLDANGNVSASVEPSASAVKPPSNVQGRAVAIDLGPRYCMGLTNNGCVVVWGDQYAPASVLTVPSAAQNEVVAIVASGNSCLAIKSNGTVVAWGQYNQVPASIQGKTLAISSSGSNCMALQEDGSIVGWNLVDGSLLPVPAGLNLFTGGDAKPGVNPDISGQWALDSVKDGTAYDISGNSNHGVITGATLTTGIISNALKFNGVDDKVTFSYSKPENNFTLEAWVKSTETHQIDAQSNSGTAGIAGQKYIFGANQEGANGGIGVSVGTNGISVYEHGDGYLPALAVYNGDIGTDWTHVVVVVENQTPKIYLNGQLKRTGEKSARPKTLAPTILGYGNYGAFKGRIDEVAVYNKVLTAAEIEQKYKKIIFLDKITLTNQDNAQSTARCTFGTHLNKLEFELHKPVNQLTLALDFPSNMGIGRVEEIIFNDTDNVSVPASAATILEGQTIKISHPLKAGKYTLKLILTINQELIVQTKAYSDDQGTLTNNESGRFEFEFMDFKDLPNVM
jgi:hypothetical protein